MVKKFNKAGLQACSVISAFRRMPTNSVSTSLEIRSLSSMTPSFDWTPSSARTIPIFRQSDSFQHMHDADLHNSRTETPGCFQAPPWPRCPASTTFLNRRCRPPSIPGTSFRCLDSGFGASKRLLVSVGTALVPGNRIGLAVNLISDCKRQQTRS